MKVKWPNFLGAPKRMYFAYLTLFLCVGQVFVVLASWLLTAAMPEQYLHSLLSAEGIRWFFGKFADNMASPVLVGLVLFSISYGTVKSCHILHYDNSIYRQRIAMRLVLVELLMAVGIMLCLTIVPHAILLNVMGGLIPSSFSASIFPYCCCTITVISISYGLMSGIQKTVMDVFDSLTTGVALLSPLYIIYILASQLYYSFIFLSAGY